MKIATTRDPGINYAGLFDVNTDKETGIRYGVIPANHVHYWYEESEPHYGNAHCPYCGEDLNTKEREEMDCPCCGEHLAESDWYEEDPLSWYIDDVGVQAEQTQGDPDIFVMKSQYYTYAQHCSPCAPGACYLLSPLTEYASTENNKCYCFGPEWFEEDECPYPVWSVETGKQIYPEER
jgi:hypothetical protein